MNSKLNILTRQLNRASVAGATEAENPQARMMTSYKEDVDRQKVAAIKAVEDKLDAAQSEIASLKAQLVEAGREQTRCIKEYGYRLDAVKETHKQELDAMAQKRYDENGMVHAELDAAKRECAMECQAKVKAETELAGANKAIAKLEQVNAKLQNDLKAKPVVAPAAAARKPLKIRVTQRDENGRIAELAEV